MGSKIVHAEVVGKDGPALHKFYGDVFGWAAQTHGAGPMGQYTEWQTGGRSVGG